MIDNVIMILTLQFLLFDILYGAQIESDNQSFFNVKNAQAMRGFWCIIVILVHIPALYQNRIQDMIGSFAYIGVTFFFMTSSYGLSLSLDRNPNSIRFFWCKRLPRLLVISWVVNAFEISVDIFVLNKNVIVTRIFAINEWVKWLLACYFFMWISFVVCRGKSIWKVITCLMVVASSLYIYFAVANGHFNRPAWTPECYGFVWGIILSSINNRFRAFFLQNWKIKWMLSTVVSLAFGVAYLKYKPVPFTGSYVLKVVLGLAITLFVLISNVKIDYGNKVNLFIGKISFEVYLIHSIVFEVLAAKIPWLSSGLFILLSIVLTVFAATIIHWVSEKIVAYINGIILVQNV